MYIHEIKQLGVYNYTTYVSDGHSVYKDRDDQKCISPAKYPELAIAAKSLDLEFLHVLKIHQAGQTDYPTFCQEAAKLGVAYWKVDLFEMTCGYYNKDGNKILVEGIPNV